MNVNSSWVWVQPVWQLCKQKQETSVPGIRKKVSVVWIQCELKENLSQTVTHDGRQLSVENWHDKLLFYSFPLCLYPWGLERRDNKDTPPPVPSGASWYPSKFGVDWWRTQCTEESQASELQIDKCKVKTCLHTCQKLVCVRSTNTGSDSYYSDLNVVILQVSQHNNNTTADNSFFLQQTILDPAFPLPC